MSKGKYLAIDYGDRRVGLAISDFDKEMAFPREVITYENQAELVRRLADFCESESVSRVIVGLPIEMDGSMGEQFQKTQQFGALLKDVISPIPVEYFDERLTSKQAKRMLHKQGFKERDHKGQTDMISAQLILEAYMAKE